MTTTSAKPRIKLGAPPKNFVREVEFALLDGDIGAIGCTFKYRTRKQYAELQDTMAGSAKKEDKLDLDAADLWARLTERGIAENAKYLAEILEAWDLEQPLSHETLTQLLDEQPAAGRAIFEAYQRAIVEGRSGN